MDPEVTRFKQQAAELAVQQVESGMVIGLGHGSTAILALRCLAERISTGRVQDILGVPCSTQVEGEAQRLGIPLTTLEDHPVVDLTIDGADEVDSNLDLIKGAGGALLREKIVAQASLREIIVVDESKISPALGTRRAVPVEVVPFGWQSQLTYLQSLGAQATVRQANGRSKGPLFRTDNDNLVLDCEFGPIREPAQLAARIRERAGIVEHGLFLGLATEVIVAGRNGVVQWKRNIPNIFGS
jgi:ribose 5-phosphate isomerase A